MNGLWGSTYKGPAPHRAFSLVELVVVVVIIGSIAAIAIPRISRGAEGAGQAALGADLGVLRRAIDMYAAEHGGAFPAERADGRGGTARSEDAFVSQLTLFTSFAGLASDVRDANFRYGPYLRAVPPAPVGPKIGMTGVKVGTTGPAFATGEDVGWVYNVLTGEIIVNASTAVSGESFGDTELIGGGGDIGLENLGGDLGEIGL